MEGFSKIFNCLWPLTVFGEAPSWMFDWLSGYVIDMNDKKIYQKVALYYLFEIGYLILLKAVKYINNTFKENVVDKSLFFIYSICMK